MIFNFFLGNHRAGGLKGMPDLILPIRQGLMELGHHVITYGLNLRPAPAVNLLVEFFSEDGPVDELIRLKTQARDGFIFGIICTEDIEDRLVMEQPEFPRRRPNLERLLPVADFVWTLLPQAGAYEALAGPGKVELLEYGFSQRLLARRIIREPGLRDIDVLMYGNETPYRKPIVEQLRQRGLTCFVTNRQLFPDFIASDFVTRSKVVLDLRRGPGVRYPSPTRICKSLHGGVLVAAEHLGDSGIANLYNYTVACRYDELTDRCEQIVRSGMFVNLGLAALEKFKTETSMATNMKRILRSPTFARLAPG